MSRIEQFAWIKTLQVGDVVRTKNGVLRIVRAVRHSGLSLGLAPEHSNDHPLSHECSRCGGLLVDYWHCGIFVHVSAVTGRPTDSTQACEENDEQEAQK